MKRKIIYIILALIFFLGSVTFYINTVAIPKYLKKIIIQDAQKFLGRKIVLQDLHFNPFKGFVLNGITIFEENSPDAFATVVNANVNFLYWPFLRERKIVLSSVELNAVSLNLIHYAGDQWNFSDIIERRSKNRQQQSLKVYVSRLMLTDSRIKLTNLEDGSQFSDVFDQTDAGINFSFSKGIIFHASTSIADKNGLIKMEGTYSPAQNKLSGDIKLKNFPLKNYLRLSTVQMPFILDNINIDDIAVELAFAKHLATVKGDVALSNLSLRTDSRSLETKSLSMNQINFAFKDGEINFNGATAARGVKAVSLGQSYSADGIDIQVDRLTARGKTFNASGALKTTGAAIAIPQQLVLSGDLNLNGIRLSQGANVLSVEAGAEFKNTSLTVHDNIHVKGDFLSPGFSFTRTPDTTTAKGNIDAANLVYQWPTDKELSGHITLTDIRVNGKPDSPWTAQSNLRGQGVGIKLPNGKILTTDLIGAGVMQYLTQAKTFQIKSNYQLSNAVFKISSAMTLTGNPSGTVSVTSKTDPLKPLPYNGWMEFKDGAFQGTKIGNIENINGAVSFENNALQTSGLDFLALGMPASLKGTLNDFSSPSVNIAVHVNDFDMAAAERIIPDIIHKNQLTLQGIAPSLDVSYKGAIDTTENADIRFSAELKDSVITSGALNKTASKLLGNVSYTEKILSWKDLSAEFNGTTYKLTGNISPSPKTTVDTTVEGDNLKLNTRFTYSPEAINFEKLTGRYKNALFDVTGTAKSSSGGTPMVDFSGEAELDLKDLPALFPTTAESIKNYRLSGKTTIRGQFAGDAAHWQDWQYNLTGASPQFSIWGLNLENIKFNAVQKNNLLKPFHLWGDFYTGELNLVASLDTAKKELPLELVVRVLNSDLKKLKADTPFKKQSLAGILSATAIIDGTMADLSKLNGKGGVEIKDGLLWEFDLLKGLGGILLIPEYKDIVFTQAGMNFLLKDGIMSTENIELVGPSLNLFGKGTLNFNQGQALDLWLSPDFNSDVILNSSSLKKGTTAIITQTEKFMSVNVTGTLSKPQYRVNNSPVKILQKTGGVILENVSQFFQNIF